MPALLERTTVAPGRVDRAKGLIRDVKILGYKSLNGREYTKAALESAVKLYEGCKVNINHPKNPNDPRDYNDRFGWLENVKLAPDGLRGDLRFNPNHKLAERICWDAENAPNNLGLSHNAVGETREGREGQIVNKITKVNSVDLVADPATTKGLFESRDSSFGDWLPRKARSSSLYTESAAARVARWRRIGADEFPASLQESKRPAASKTATTSIPLNTKAAVARWRRG